MMRSLLLLFSVAAACVSFGCASLIVREVEERLSSEQLRAELGFSSDVLPAHALVQVDLSDSARSRRDAGEEVPMTVDVLGHNITVDLAPNSDLLPSSYVLQTVGEDGTLHTIPSHVRRDCYYTGHVQGTEGSHVAVQMCEGHEMTGMIMNEGHAVIVKPMKNSSLHLVYEATEAILSGDPVDEVESSRPLSDARRVARSVEISPRGKRQSSVKETIEMMVYIDKQTADYHGADNVEGYVITVLNVFASLYNDPSLLGPPVHVALVRLVVESTSTSPISTTANVNDLLQSFCDYQVSESFPSEDSDPQHHDFAVFLSRRDLYSVDSAGNQQRSTIGFAPVGSMCNSPRSCTIIQDQGTVSAFTMAHEAGHVFSMEHDGTRNDCNPEGNIMAARLATGPGLFKWSSCSANYLEQYRGRGRTECLHDTPGGTGTRTLNATALPGRNQSPTDQCRKSRGSSSSQCNFSQTPDQFCRQMYCRGTDNLCYSQLPLEGTRCDTGKSCYEGRCVADSLLDNPIHGQWSAWGAWSGCSRTCGGGVRTRTRQCNNPAPQYGGSYCEGKNYEVEYCSPNACASDTYRNEQCAALNSVSFNGQFYNWSEYDNERAGAPPCDLVCLSSDNFFSNRGVVADGTSCKASNGYDKAICLRGACTNVGCDNRFDGAKADRCGVCQGDGSSCSLVTRTFSATNQPFGYNAAITIPAGVHSVVIREDPFNTNNYFALSVGGTRLLNANLQVVRQSDIRAAGVTWEYSRSSTAETLSASGTLTQPANIEALVGTNGNNVRFTYEYIMNNPTTQPPTTQPPTTQPPTTRPPTTQPPTTRPPTTQPPTTQPPTTQPPTTQPPTTRPPTTQPPTTRPPTTQPPTTQPPTTRPPTTQPPTTRPPTTQPPTTQPPTTQPPTTQPPTTRPPTTQPPTTQPPSSCSNTCVDQYTICSAYKRYCASFAVVRDVCCHTCHCT